MQWLARQPWLRPPMPSGRQSNATVRARAGAACVAEGRVLEGPDHVNIGRHVGIASLPQDGSYSLGRSRLWIGFFKTHATGIE